MTIEAQYVATIADLRDEIARLQDQINTCRELRKYGRNEIERLRAERDSARIEIERLRAENAALRTVLADTPDPHEVEHMRRALESKP